MTLKSFALAASLLTAPTLLAETARLSELEGIEKITFLAGEAVRANRSTNNNPLTIQGQVYASGIGTHAPSVAIIELNGADSFHSIIGIDDEADRKANHGIIDYVVTAYGTSTADATQLASGHLDRMAGTWSDTLDFNGLERYKYLKIDMQQGAQAWADHVDLADASLTYTGEKPRFVAAGEMFVQGTVKLPATPTIEGAQIIPLSSLQLANISNGWGTIRPNKSIDNNPITIKGSVYESGVGLHATAKVVVKLNGTTPKFHATLGLDDEISNSLEGNSRVNKNTELVAYKVLLRRQGGATTTACEGTLRFNDPQPVEIDLDGLGEYKYLIIELDQNGSNECDHVDLGNAYFEFLYQNSNEPELVPESSLAAGLDAATTVFSQPNVRFMHRLRALNPDAAITVSDLPEGLTFNEKRNLVEGKIAQEGVYTYTVTVSSDGDEVSSPITLTVSSDLQQPVPFMGWLSWNAIERNISETVIKAVADQMEEKGLIEAGYTYLVIDDLWHADARGEGGETLENPTKFPSGMKASADYVHSKGMKFGIYSDAATRTCAGAYGGLGYEEIDAKNYAKWGVDILKYDYCGAPTDVASAKTRYKAMGDALKNSGRNIILYICEWGPREPWKWGAEVGGSCWRATYDTRDCWIGASGGIGIVQSIAGMKDIWAYNGVNRFNDADMMMLGLNGTGRSSSHLCQTGPGMTKDEYRTQLALWCMWSSPLTLSNDMSQPLSEVDHAIMTNAELIALDQDRMGQAAETIFHDANDYLLLAKDCENGDVAISLTNLTGAAKTYTVDFSEIGALDAGQEYFVRDCQNHADLPSAKGSIEIQALPSHATAVYRLTPKATSAIEALSAPAADMQVQAADSLVSVTIAGAAPKRLILSDMAGRVVDAAEGTAQTYALRAPAPGIYVVNAVCQARSQSKMIKL